MKLRILIAYFSGTGGTRQVAETLFRQTQKLGHETILFEIDDCADEDSRAGMERFLSAADLLIVAYAVHAVDAPDPVYRWIARLEGRRIPSAVISVSGGGEVWPNTVCRQNCVAALERKGFSVTWEDMIVMPCNMIFSYPDVLNACLLSALPLKTALILDGFCRGETRRLPYRKADPFQRALQKGEKNNIHNFARTIRVTDDCVACGWCERNCPTGNISIRDARPSFADSCVGCLRCVYGCPKGALTSKNFLVIKTGFDMGEIARRSAGSGAETIRDKPAPDYRKFTRGPLYAGVRKYLDEVFGDGDKR